MHGKSAKKSKLLRNMLKWKESTNRAQKRRNSDPKSRHKVTLTVLRLLSWASSRMMTLYLLSRGSVRICLSRHPSVMYLMAVSCKGQVHIQLPAWAFISNQTFLHRSHTRPAAHAAQLGSVSPARDPKNFPKNKSQDTKSWDRKFPKLWGRPASVTPQWEKHFYCSGKI